MHEILLGKSVEEIKSLLAGLTEKIPSYMAGQIAQWIYKKHAVSFDEMTNISVANREILKENFSLGLVAPSVSRLSKDGTEKFLFDNVETVLIPSKDRLTLCISSQAGCKMNCTFCATGKMGFSRQLSVAEILNQYAFLARDNNITNIVFMGMGEPLDNIFAVMEAIRALTAEWGFALSPRRITVSTIGMLPALCRLIEDTECHIAISLHNAFHTQRLALMPVEKTFNIEEIVELLKNYDWAHQRKLSFEYIMLGGLNDSLLHAKTLWKMVRDLPCHINLIPYNANGTDDFVRSSNSAVEAFCNFLTEKGVSCTVRSSRGEDIEAACGLLATTH
ncbi:MAG: 23S rRNA (adenine(2503)-C(2))-methyltransferase RlmN [Bacteroidales bacterium]|jgi:23S rRNA (adenine2503-C2)-methyltransferase|nr:23S rRNA (adenine(2503)-C(2))-methyltransferase RlmN [Bacteroidales bacterium]